MCGAIFCTVVRFGFILFFSTLILTSCSSGSGVDAPENTAPTASSVSIVDDNAGSAVVGDVLTGNYTYSRERCSRC